MSYDLNIPGPMSTKRDTLSTHDPGSLSPLSSGLITQPWVPVADRVCRFPLMELPPELRTMIAKYALHEPEGLAWVWTAYRKVQRVATLRGGGVFSRSKTLQDFNALGRTCKTLHDETRGLVLEVNIIKILSHCMHSFRPSSNWYESSNGTDWFLRVAAEALGLWHRSAPLHLRLKQQHVKLHCHHGTDFEKHMAHFKQTTDSFRHLHLDFIWGKWQLKALSAFEVQELMEMEKYGEPYISEYDQMRERLNTFLDIGRNVHGFVSKVNDVDRTWRVFPTPMDREDMTKILGFLTEDEQCLVQQWEVDGI